MVLWLPERWIAAVGVFKGAGSEEEGERGGVVMLVTMGVGEVDPRLFGGWAGGWSSPSGPGLSPLAWAGGWGWGGG